MEPQKFKQDSTEKQRHSSRRAQGPGSIFNRFTLTINAVPKKAATFRFAAIVSWIFDSRQSRLGSTFPDAPLFPHDSSEMSLRFASPVNRRSKSRDCLAAYNDARLV